MPPKKPLDSQPLESPEVLVPFTVLINGHDRTIFAKDADDLQRRISKIREAEVK